MNLITSFRLADKASLHVVKGVFPPKIILYSVFLPNTYTALFFLISLPPAFLSPPAFVLLSVHGDRILRASADKTQIQVKVSVHISRWSLVILQLAAQLMS